jgi:hypothetical protein
VSDKAIQFLCILHLMLDTVDAHSEYLQSKKDILSSEGLSSEVD